MQETISIIADVCGILGFIISLFAVNQIQNIKKNSNRVDVRDTHVGGDFTGRDKIQR